MEQLAYTVLKNDEIAAEYKEKFKYIFVDEYQDTNSIQDAIIAAVSNGHNLFMSETSSRAYIAFARPNRKIFWRNIKAMTERLEKELI